MWTFILYALLFWFLYNLIFRFIIPVYRATRKVKQQFSEMHSRMQETMNPNQPKPAAAGSSPVSRPETPPRKSDYIEFEEVK